MADGDSFLVSFEGVLMYDGIQISGPVRVSQLLDNVIDGEVVERRALPSAEGWWLCPNEPRCGHGAALHDVEDFDDPSPRCCFEGCTCGREVSVDR